MTWPPSAFTKTCKPALILSRMPECSPSLLKHQRFTRTYNGNPAMPSFLVRNRVASTNTPSTIRGSPNACGSPCGRPVDHSTFRMRRRLRPLKHGDSWDSRARYEGRWGTAPRNRRLVFRHIDCPQAGFGQGHFLIGDTKQADARVGCGGHSNSDTRANSVVSEVS